jgi:hypothetical protein
MCQGDISNWIPFLVAMERTGYRMILSVLSNAQLDGKLINNAGKTCAFSFNKQFLYLNLDTTAYNGNDENHLLNGMNSVEKIMNSNQLE